jgi:protein-disulfide isomerase
MCATRSNAALALLLLAAAPAAAFDPGDMTAAERAAFGAEVRALLLEEPEIVGRALAPGPSYAEEAARDSAMLDGLAGALYDDPADYTAGPEDGTPLVAFLPAACDTCAETLAQLHAIVEENGATRLIVKDFPASAQGDPAAAAFLTALLEDMGPKAWQQARKALPDLPDPGDRVALRRLAEAMGWPADRLMARMAGGATEAVLERRRALARELGFDVFPSYVVGGTMIRGDVPPALLARYLP